MKNNLVRDWQLYADKEVSVNDFNNVFDVEKFGICPGQTDDGAHIIDIKEESTLKTFRIDEFDYLYCYKSNGYFYAILKDNTEVIGAEENGVVTPFIQGAGGFFFKTGTGEVLYDVLGMDSFEVTEGEYTRVVVSYKTQGDYGYAPLSKTEYIFKERCITAKTSIICQDMKEGLYHSCFKRSHLNIPSEAKNRVAFKTEYPKNNDFAYKQVDSYVLSETYGDIIFYSFARSCGQQLSPKGYGIDALPYKLERNTQNVEDVYEIDFVITPKSSNDSFVALFKGKNMDFAAGVCSVEHNNNTTMFKGKNVLLNIAVQNITNSEIDFSVRYNIISYDNEEVYSHIYHSNLLDAGEQAHRNLELHFDKYGMYYLNLYVSTKGYEYRECYPFAMLEEFEFKHRDTNPFGICETHHDSKTQGNSIVSLLNDMGISIVRSGAQTSDEFFKQMHDCGIPRFATGHNFNKTEDGIEKYLDGIRKDLNRFADDCTYYLMCNETDSPTKSNYDKAKKYINESFVPYAFNPAYELISKEYPQVLNKAIWQSNCHGTTEWLEAFYESGVWDKSEFIDIHSYSSPSGPDKVFSNQNESMFANTFSNEYAAIRWKRIQNRYGKKRLIIGETGYPSSAACGDTREIDIRTQADFNIRIALFFLEAGAEDIIFYCLLDRTSFLVGTSRWNEMYFGAVTNADYYGVYMPKPWAAAYANMTRRFDGYVSCSKNSKYEEDEFGTLRAFDVKTKDNGVFTVLWSNIYMQPNTTAQGRVNNVERIPMPAWESRWLETETRLFDTCLDKVRVVDIMGNEKYYTAVDGKVQIEVSGSPIYVYGIK